MRRTQRAGIRLPVVQEAVDEGADREGAGSLPGQGGGDPLLAGRIGSRPGQGRDHLPSRPKDSSIQPTLTAPAETIYDETRVARLGGRLAGTVRFVLKHLGDPVAAQEVVAVIESAEVGKAKSELMRTVAELATADAAATRARASSAAGFRTASEAQEAEARLRAAQLGVFDAEQGLLNLGLPVTDADLTLPPAELMSRLRTLGLPASIPGETRSANLLPIRAPQAGVVTEIHAVPGESIDAGAVLMVVADPSTLWLAMALPVEEAARVAPGRSVHFTSPGGTTGDGTVITISPAADDTTRLVAVRAAIDNRTAGLRAHQIGTATITLGEAISAVVLPPEAIQYDGETAYVFVRRSPTIFRGLAVPVLSRTPAGVAVGRLLPGDEVAVTGTAMLKGNLFQDKFGADDD